MITPMSVSALLASSKDKVIGIVLWIETFICFSISQEKFFDGNFNYNITEGMK